MKKSTLISLLTAATVIITTAGTYAVWDSLTDSTTESITFRNPVTVEVSPEYTLTEAAASLGVDPSASGDVTFTVSNDNNLAKQLKIVPSVSGGTASISDFDFVITDKNNMSTPLTGDATSGFVDTTLDSTIYTVTVTPKNNSVARQEVSITLTATLE